MVIVARGTYLPCPLRRDLGAWVPGMASTGVRSFFDVIILRRGYLTERPRFPLQLVTISTEYNSATPSLRSFRLEHQEEWDREKNARTYKK